MPVSLEVYAPSSLEYSLSVTLSLLFPIINSRSFDESMFDASI
jgi:hypothetical protein